MRALVNPETLDILDHLETVFSLLKLRPHFQGNFQRRKRHIEESLTPELAAVRARLLYFDDFLAELQSDGEPIYAEGDPSALNWLTYFEECKVVPIYHDAIALMRRRPLVKREEVEHLIRFTSFTGSKYGVDDAETHGFGYHFHFGRVNGNTLMRANVVLTFDHRQPQSSNEHDPLFVEEHGSGRYKHIDIATIGQNIRYPVYKICEHEMASIGRQHFKIPSKKSLLFY